MESKKKKFLMTKEKLEREHDGLISVIAKCFRALLPSDKVDVNYVAKSTFLRIHCPLFKVGDDKSIFDLYNRVTCSK